MVAEKTDLGTFVQVTFHVVIPRTSLASANNLYADIQKFLAAFADTTIDMSVREPRETRLPRR